MKFLLPIALLLFSFLPLYAQAPALDPAEVELRRQSFEKVWSTVNEKHYDSTFGGVDWAKVRETYAPKAAEARSRDEFHAVLRKMLGELKLSHFGIFPKDVENTAKQKTNGTIGIDLKILEGTPVITRVEPGSAAALAGLKPGHTVQSVDGRTTSALLKPFEDSLAGRSLTPGMQQIYRERIVHGLIDGIAGTTLKLGFLDEKEQAREVEILRAGFTGEMSAPLGNFPAQEVIFESKKLASGVGYIRFNMWTMPQIQKFREAMKGFADAKGVIIDLRGNPGGVGGIAPAFAGLLTDKSTSLGSMNTRDSQMKFVVYPQPNPFLGKVAILTDYGSGSTSEVFAAGVQEIGRAKIVGETSAGAVLPSVFDTLPTGVIFQYVVSDYRSPKNILIEGRGVIPDVEVKLTRGGLLKGIDEPLTAAEKVVLN